jgi:hypothetical protein
MNHRARRFIQGGLPPGADKRIWEDSFNCPQCGALAQQDWFDGGIEEGPKKKFGAMRLLHKPENNRGIFQSAVI